MNRRDYVEERLEVLETYRNELTNLADEIDDKELKQNIQYLIIDTDDEYEELSEEERKYEREEEDYLNKEYMRGAL